MTRDRGRPRTFDIDTALDSALVVFWRHGFLDASLNELTASMGLSKPSLYAAFGDKASLYLQALRRYIDLRIAPHVQLLMSEPGGYQAIEGFLKSVATMLADPALPGGCFIVTGSIDCGRHKLPQDVELSLHAALQGTAIKLKERLTRAQQEGDLPANTAIDELADFFSALLSGLAVQAKAGASASKLHQVIDNAMRAWPKGGNKGP